MRSILHLNAFYIFNLLLIFIFSIIVNSNNSFSLVYTSLFCIFHFIIIYLGIYYYRKSLYLILFLYGLGLDILWLNEIGPHLIVFMFMLVFFNLTIKYWYNLNSYMIYSIILILQFIIITLEIIFSYMFFQHNISLEHFLQIFFISLIVSFPTFLFFSYIDKFK
jgi:hypothetical protein